MQFDKPKVTIDLQEYHYLKQKAEEVDTNEMLLASKKIIGALLINGGLTGRTLEYIHKEKIVLTTSHELQYGLFEPDYIKIGLIKESKPGI